MEKKRVEWIDISRGIAIIAVIIGHSLGKYWLGGFAKFIFAFHMPIFFVLSGYLFHLQSKKVVLKKGIFNLLLPYAGTVMIELLILFFCKIFPNSYLYSRFGNANQLIIAGIYGVGSRPTLPFSNDMSWIGAIWFLMAMFFATQIFNSVMLVKFKKNDLLKKGIIIVTLTFLGVSISPFVTLPFSLSAALCSQSFIFSGYLLKRFKLLKQVNGKIMIILLMIWLISAKVGRLSMLSATSPNMFVSIVGGIAASVFIMRVSILFEKRLSGEKLGNIKKIFTFWGSQSLLILCFHLIELDNVRLWGTITDALGGRISYVAIIIIGIVYRILFASVCAFIVKYLPLLRNVYMNRKFPFKFQ